MNGDQGRNLELKALTDRVDALELRVKLLQKLLVEQAAKLDRQTSR